jgi:hypothetical protein
MFGIWHSTFVIDTAFAPSLIAADRIDLKPTTNAFGASEFVK